MTREPGYLPLRNAGPSEGREGMGKDAVPLPKAGVINFLKGDKMAISFFYPGSAGEILQGKVQGRDVLVSFPVNLYTRVEIFEGRFSGSEVEEYAKSFMFFKNILKRWGVDGGNLCFKINSKIPKGKGFASSTADLCALYHCLVRYFRRKFDITELVEEALRIEPTDSIVFNRATLFDYKNGKYYKILGDYIKFFIYVFEGQEEVDTIKFNLSVKEPLAEVDDLVPVLVRGIEDKDIRKISFVSTESIKRNQRRLYYPVLQEVESMMKKTGGLGIIGGHSGNFLGIIYDKKLDLDIKIEGFKNYWVNTLSRIY